MKIGLVVDNPFRDLPGIVLLARELAIQGADVYLIPYNLRDAEVWSLAPDFVLLNFLRTVNETWTQKLVDAQIQFGVLDTEGSVFAPVPKWALDDFQTAEHILDKSQEVILNYMVIVARSAKVRRAASCYLSWSSYFSQFLIDNSLYTREQVKDTGSIRTDMLTEPLRKASRAMSGYADQYSQPLVLINGSFPMANPAFQSSAQEVELMMKLFKFSRKFCDEVLRTQTVALREMTRMANELAKSFPHVTFVFRPHPFENLSTYRLLLDDRPNLILKKEGTVDGWLLRSSAVIQCGSSTAVEASVIGVPALYPAWLPLHIDVKISSMASRSIANMEELKSCLSDILENRYQVSPEKQSEIARAIDLAYGPTDGHAHVRAASEILKSYRSTSSQPLLRTCKKHLYDVLASGSKLGKKLRKATGLLTGESIHWSWAKMKECYRPHLPWEQTEKHFDATQVQTMLDAVEAVLPSTSRGIEAVPTPASDYHFGFKEGRSVLVKQRR